MRKLLWDYEHFSNDTNCEIRYNGCLVHSLVPLRIAMSTSISGCTKFWELILVP